MEQIQNWAFSVCTASIVGALINMLVPEGSISGTFKTVTCVFFLCVVIYPLSEIKFKDIDFSYEEQNIIYDETEELNLVSAEYIENQILDSVNDFLKSEGIFAKDISIKINISENGSIDINKFVLTFESLEDPVGTEEKIYQKTGIRPKIILSGEN